MSDLSVEEREEARLNRIINAKKTANTKSIFDKKKEEEAKQQIEEKAKANVGAEDEEDVDEMKRQIAMLQAKLQKQEAEKQQLKDAVASKQSQPQQQTQQPPQQNQPQTAPTSTTAATTVAPKSAPVQSTVPTTTTTCDETKFAQEILKEINLLRTNPSAYAAKLEGRLARFSNKIYVDETNTRVETMEGAEAVSDAITELKNREALQAMVLADGLSHSVADLISLIGPIGKAASYEEDSSDRLVKYGKWKGNIAELISYGFHSANPENVVAQWVIDDGNKSRPQRNALLSTRFSVIGAAVGDHASYEKMAVVAVTQGYTDKSGKSFGTEQRVTTSKFKATAGDNKFIEIDSDILPDNVSNVSLLLINQSQVQLSFKNPATNKTITSSWDLPFAFPSRNITAKLLANRKVHITVDKTEKAKSDVETQSFNLHADTNSPTDRLKAVIKQTTDKYSFILNPCSVAAKLNVSIINNSTLQFEAIYTIIDDDGINKSTKTITRMEKITIPFVVFKHLMNIEVNDNNAGITVIITKPTATSNQQETIKIDGL